MSLFRLSKNVLEEVPQSSFEALGIRERDDLQRLLRDRPDVLEEGLLIVAEEFSNWEDSRRRIDLLALDSELRIVVVELKRDESGGAMELQAVRYAAMVANITFDQLVDAHAKYLSRLGIDGDPRKSLLEAVGAEESAEIDIRSQRPRIMLVSADFSAELTTSVLWLNDLGLDIRCIRIRPYDMDDEVFLEVSQVIPLPEAEDYLVKVRQKAKENESQSYPTVEWSAEDVERLRTQMAHRKVSEVLTLLSSQPDRWFKWGDIVDRSGRTSPQVRGDVAGLTRHIRSEWRRDNWPFEVRADEKGKVEYMMPAELAGGESRE